MTISKYLKMDSAQLEKEIEKQNKKIITAKETISLLRKLQIASKESEKQKTQTEKINIPQNHQSQKPIQPTTQPPTWKGMI